MIYVKHIDGQATAQTQYAQRELKLNDELHINETLSTQNTLTIAIEGSEDLTITHGNNLLLDTSVISTNIVDEATISLEQLHSFDFISNGSFELTQNELVDFSNLQNDTTEIEIKETLNINDLIEDQNNEIKIYSDTTEQISMDQTQWTKQDSQIVENNHTFDVYSKNTDLGELSSLLIEDDISILYNQG